MNNDEGCDTGDDKIKEAVIDYVSEGPSHKSHSLCLVFSYADTEPVMFCLSQEENRNPKQQPTATAAASYLDILNWEKFALPTVTTVARVSR